MRLTKSMKHDETKRSNRSKRMNLEKRKKEKNMRFRRKPTLSVRQERQPDERNSKIYIGILSFEREKKTTSISISKVDSFQYIRKTQQKKSANTSIHLDISNTFAS